MPAQALAVPQGTENLEVMTDAVNYNSWLVHLVRKHTGARARLLDFGAGIGTFAAQIADPDQTVLCVEPDAAARMRLRDRGLDAFAHPGQIQPGTVDAVYSLNVLEHIEDDVAALDALRRCLKPDGCLFLYVPAFMTLYSAMDRHVGHVRRYRMDTLIRAVEAAGFHVLSTGYADSLGFFASLLFRAIGNDSGTINRNALILYDRVIFPLSRLLDGVACKPFFGKNVWLFARPKDGLRLVS